LRRKVLRFDEEAHSSQLGGMCSGFKPKNAPPKDLNTNDDTYIVSSIALAIKDLMSDQNVPRRKYR
jgi:hypothetical protein